MKHILCIDPGDGTGWCKMFINGKIIEFENLTQDEVDDRLNNYSDPKDCEAVIYEDFKLFGHKAAQQRGSRFVASQVIALVRSFAKRHSIKLVVQVPGNKNTGQLWSQLKPPSDHKASHRVDAYNHGFFYLRNTYQIPTALERKAWNA